MDDSDLEQAERRSDRRGIQSVEAGMRVIDALRQSNGPQTLKDLAALSEIPASNCHRYLVSFVRTGYVRQDLATSRYDLGPKLLQAGLAALSRIDAVTVGNDALIEVVEQTGQSGVLTIWTDRGAVILRLFSGRKMVRTNLAAGETIPLLRSASGRAFLAFLPKQQTQSVAGRELPMKKKELDAIVEEIKQAGVSEVHGGHIPGLSAVAAPILDHNGEPAVVLALFGLVNTISTEDVAKLRTVAARASARLGRASPAD